MKAGPVEFVVTNTSTDPLNGKMHEFLITPWSGALDGLPYDSANSIVLENKLANLEGLEDMLPSATATMRTFYLAISCPATTDQEWHTGSP